MVPAPADMPSLKPPQVIAAPSGQYAVGSRAFQGIPSLAIAPSGRLWATWYAGRTPGEDQNNYVVVVTSGDDGRSWREARIVDPDGDGPVRAFDPEVWVDPTGRLWSFWTQSVDHDGTKAGVWAATTTSPDMVHPRWTRPKRIADGVMMCKPLVLSNGDWLLPVSTWRTNDFSARVLASTDRGRTWVLRGACQVPLAAREFDEHMLVERRDGSLWMLVRTKYGIGESTSDDGGRTWSPLTPSALAHPSARFFICRLRSGNLLLVKHGPIAKAIGRSHLTAYLSADDGRTWSSGLLLDERDGVSYPDGQQGPDGAIRIVYDRSRTGDREILMARFTEANMRGQGMPDLRIVVSRPGPAP